MWEVLILGDDDGIMPQREIPDCGIIRIPESDRSDMISLITMIFQQYSQAGGS